MSTCLIVYLSQGGTTATIAESVARGLRSGKTEVTLHNLKDGPPPDPAAFDILGIGTPVYAWRPPFMISDYLDSLPDLSGKPVFVFLLYGAYSGDAGSVVRRKLERKGGREIGYSRYRGEDLFLGYLKRGYLFSPNSPKPEETGLAELFGQGVAARFAGKAYAKPEYDAPPAAIYRIQRFLINRQFVRVLYSRLFRANRKKCNACGICTKLCPTKNISSDGQGLPIFGRSCLLCFSCQMKCPQDAVTAPVTWFLFWPFMVYNTAAASRDTAIEHARVVHGRGKTSVVK